MNIEILENIINKKKTPMLYLHMVRVGLISKDLGLYVGYNGNDLEDLVQAALLHDVGKILIPESIIYKKTYLTPEEWEEIKKHPSLGVDIVKHFSPNSVPGILYHHEKYSGGGYPKGISGDDIPLDARIISIADAFDSIRSEQLFRKAYSIINVLSYIELESGRSFAPDIVKTFKRLLYDKMRNDPSGKSLWGNGQYLL